MDLPDIASALGPGWSELHRDTLGEFFLQAYLEAAFSTERAAQAASGWGGDSYALLSREDGRTLLVALLVWDTKDDSAEFFFAFTQFMQGTADGEWEQVDGDGAAQVMSLPDKSVYLQVEAGTTLLIVAPDRSVVETVVAAVDDAG